jgi:hypothetical protein
LEKRKIKKDPWPSRILQIKLYIYSVDLTTGGVKVHYISQNKRTEAVYSFNAA